MLTSSTRSAPARARAAAATPAASRLPQIADTAVLLLIGVTIILGLVVVFLKMYIPALIFWSVAAGLGLTRQIGTQARLTNTRFEEMTRELKMIRLGLTTAALNGDGQGSVGQGSAGLSHTPGLVPGDSTAAPPK